MRKKKTTKVKKMNHDKIMDTFKENIEDLPYSQCIDIMEKLTEKIDNQTITNEEVALYLLLAMKTERF